MCGEKGHCGQSVRKRLAQIAVCTLVVSLLGLDAGPVIAAKPSTPLTVVLKHASSPSYKVRAQAALVLGTSTSDDLRVLKELSALCYDRHRVVRLAAVIALGKLGDARSVSALSDALHDEDVRVVRRAKRSVSQLVQRLSQSKVAFKDRQWNFRIRHLSQDAKFKDHVMRMLLERENIDVGAAVAIDVTAPGVKWPIELDLSGQFTKMTADTAVFALTLAFRHGGHVIQRFEPFTVTGDSVDKMLKAPAKIVVGQVIKFLGAS